MKQQILIMTLMAGLLNPAFAEKFSRDASFQICFTPGQNCTQEIVDTINQAQHSILVQAYSFTSHPIGNALVNATRRGVNVSIILDKSNLDQSHNSAEFFAWKRIPVWVDEEQGIAHNKVMVLDNTSVITGSFNFTKAAQDKNAENVLIIHDPLIAKRYAANWVVHQQISTSYHPKDPEKIEINYQKTTPPRWIHQMMRWIFK